MAIPALVKGIASFFTGDAGKEVVGFIRDRFPAKLSEAELAEIEAEADRRDMDKKERAEEWAAQQEQRFFDFTRDMEGTASDLKQVPFLGPIIIFLRGAFRPVFSYFTMYLDYRWFVHDTSKWTEQQMTAMIVINLIVLVFFFGERAVKNLAPLIARVFGGGGTDSELRGP
jgi:hypothetical protein